MGESGLTRGSQKTNKTPGLLRAPKRQVMGPTTAQRSEMTEMQPD